MHQLRTHGSRCVLFFTASWPSKRALLSRRGLRAAPPALGVRRVGHDGAPGAAARAPDALLAAQERSLSELFCTGFAGAPRPLPLKPFLLLGQLVLLDHLEGIGYGGAVAQTLTNQRSLRKLMHTALAFRVRTEPLITTSRSDVTW